MEWQPIETAPKDGTPVELEDKWGGTGIFMWGNPIGFDPEMKCWVEYGAETVGHSDYFMVQWRPADV